MASAGGPEIDRLIQLLARLPGLGPRSARRAALHLIKKRELLMAPLASALQIAMEKIAVCGTCGNIDTQNPCTVCTDPRRDAAVMLVVADVADLWALERAGAINARYHVLGGNQAADGFLICAKCPRACSQPSSINPGIPAKAQIAKNHAQPVASAT